MNYLIRSLRWYTASVPSFLFLILKNYCRHFWYVYGISKHFQTLFSPWKRQVTNRQTKGLDLEDMINTFSFNVISRVIGAIVRSSTIVLGLCVEIIFVCIWFIFVVLCILAAPCFPILYSLHLKNNPDIEEEIEKYRKDTQLMQQKISNDPYCNEALHRLELTEEKDEILQNIVLPTNITATNYQSLVQLHLDLLKLTLASPSKQTLLAKKTLSEKDVQLIFHWLQERNKDSISDAQFWSREKLQETRAIGKDWAYGFTPNLDTYGTDIARSQTYAYTCNIHEESTTEIENIFSAPHAQTVLLSGSPGVGKKTLIYFLAKRIFDGQTTPELANFRVLLLNLDSVLSSSSTDEQKLSIVEQLLQEAHNAGNTIIVIENIDKYLHSSDSHTDLSTVLSKIGKAYSVKVLATTTRERFKDTIQASGLFLSTAHTLHIEPTDQYATLTLILRVLPQYESKHRVFTYKALKEIVNYAEDIYTELPQPAASIQALESVIQSPDSATVITQNFVDEVFSKKLHVPVGSLTDTQKNDLLSLKDLLTQQVIGQDHAMDQLSQALKRAELDLNKKDKTMGAFLFLGATGVGKTETAKTLAEILFKDSKKLIRIDCAEFITPDSLSLLIGSTNRPGVLTQTVKKEPYSVVLLDEIEKAHETIRLALMTIFDEGYITDGKGDRVSFRHTLLIATSNAGSDYLYENNQEKPTTENLIDYIVNQHLLKPEFINRFDGVVLYQPLDYTTVVTVAQKKLEVFIEKLYKEKGITLTISDETFETLYSEGYSEKFGARYLERAINRVVVDRVADALLSEQVTAGGKLVI